MNDDRIYMARALELAALGLYTTDPNPRVGCVLVQAGRVIGEGWHVRTGGPHAEVHALLAAGDRARGATAYVTLEPCSHTGRTPPCADALIAAGVQRVVCAVLDPNPKVAGGGAERLRASGVDVTTGIMVEESRALNAGFFSRFERGRPLVRLKLAMSLDARTAAAGGGKQWITGESSRADVQAWRARSSAILTGAGTVRLDDPRLDVRLSYGPWVRQPLRVVLDTELNCAPDSAIFKDEHALVFAAEDAVDRRPSADLSSVADPGSPAALSPAADLAPTGASRPTSGRRRTMVRTERLPRGARGGLDLDAVVRRLAALEINELFVECGPRLAAAFMDADLVDELILYVAPHLLGSDAPPLTALAGMHRSTPLPRFEFRDQRLIQNDLRLLLTPQRV